MPQAFLMVVVCVLQIQLCSANLPPNPNLRFKFHNTKLNLGKQVEKSRKTGFNVYFYALMTNTKGDAKNLDEFFAKQKLH